MHALSLLAFLAGGNTGNPLVLSANFDQYAPLQPGIDWEECPGTTNKLLQCGRFEVPMDYKNPSAGKASLTVVRSPATQAKLGTLFLNPGGPGESGVKFLLGWSKIISTITNGQYDLVSWDPRGVGSSYPRIDCFDDAKQETDFWHSTIPHDGLEARGNFTSWDDRVAFYNQEPEVDELLHSLGKRCSEYQGDKLRYVGTTATVRDMIAMHDYLETSNSPINYWGLSYGSVLGLYFVNMYPDRVGRVVLDGVVDPTYYANRPPYERWGIQALSSDGAFEGFAQTCADSGPTKCAFTQDGWSKYDIQARARRLLDTAYDYKKGKVTWLGSAWIRKRMFQAMYRPTTWPKLARDLLGCENYFKTRKEADLNICKGIEPAKASLAVNTAPDYSMQAISCGDAVDTDDVTTMIVFDELVRVTNRVSHMFGPSWGSAGFYCHQWPARAAERYASPWDKQLSNQIIVIGNDHDPVTPLRSAKNVAAMLKDSAVLVEQDHWGHTSLAMQSTCTRAILKEYFTKHIKPAGGKVCGTDRDKVIFDPPKQAIQSTTSSSNSTAHPAYFENASGAILPFVHGPQFGVIGLTFAVAVILCLLMVLGVTKRLQSTCGVTFGRSVSVTDKERLKISNGVDDSQTM